MSPEPPVDNDGVGATLWLPRKTSTPAHVVCPKVADRNAAATIAIAGRELQESWQGGQVTLRLVSEGSDNDGYHIKYKAADHSVVVSAHRPLGLLYGAYALLRWQATKEGNDRDADWTSAPALQRRMLNHWDNPDGSVERGYAGKSIWKWEQITKNGMTDSLRQRLTIYARANASVGINAMVVNNVNASPKMVRDDLEFFEIRARDHLGTGVDIVHHHR
ncbi:MAG TPA: hypothetical protein DHV83_02110, partial [Prevotella sp.]|nr:hypothetical protein [Prevotella sp.]